jgi:Putative serine esterase (DUF676)
MTSTAVHLLVLIHGMWGNPNHCAELNRIARETHSTPSPEGVELEVLVAETNRAESTHDGIDWGGERVAKEVWASLFRRQAMNRGLMLLTTKVTNKIQELEAGGRKVTRFSVTGYSLGGLVGRYLIGLVLITASTFH